MNSKQMKMRSHSDAEGDLILLRIGHANDSRRVVGEVFSRRDFRAVRPHSSRLGYPPFRPSRPDVVDAVPAPTVRTRRVWLRILWRFIVGVRHGR